MAGDVRRAGACTEPLRPDRQAGLRSLLQEPQAASSATRSTSVADWG